MENNREDVAPRLCRNNCGFFGSPATNNFCSKCYKEYFLRSLQSSLDFRDKKNDEKGQLKEKKSEEMDGAQLTGLVGEQVGLSEKTPVQTAIKQRAKRCAVCNRKVGLMGFKCRCENLFCSVHRYSDKHECKFNYREAGQDAISKVNPIVKADKIDRI